MSDKVPVVGTSPCSRYLVLVLKKTRSQRAREMKSEESVSFMPLINACMMAVRGVGGVGVWCGVYSTYRSKG